jgi:hypothetical protein
MSKIRFEFETDDYYSSEDLENLKAALGEVLTKEFDESAETIDAATCAIVTPEGELSDDEKQKVIADFVANAQVEFQVQARFRNEDGKTVGNSVSATGMLD